MKSMPLLILIVTLALSSSLFSAGFEQSKKALSRIYSGQPLQMVAFYSNCTFHRKGKKLVPNLQSCGYQVRKNSNRANRIEWEHVMPAYHIGLQLQCWREGGRKNCKRTSPKFKKMEADMHNLVPAIGEINGDRSNFKFGMLEGEAKQYGAVDVEINFKRRVIEPPNYVKGNIARTYFYMRDRYSIRISKQQTKLFEAWSRTDPVDDQELLRNKLITQIQGSYNPYIEKIKTVQAKTSTPAPHSKFQCEKKRYCKQMTSCSEAKFHLHKCGNSKLDRDKDGTPCESLCK